MSQLLNLVPCRLHVDAPPFRYCPAAICELLTNSWLSWARLVSSEANLCLLFLPRHMGQGLVHNFFFRKFRSCFKRTTSPLFMLEGAACCFSSAYFSSLLSDSDHAREWQGEQGGARERAKFRCSTTGVWCVSLGQTKGQRVICQ